MSAVLVIARNEVRRMFVSPLAWSVLAVLQLLLGFALVKSLYDLVQDPSALSGEMGLTQYIGGGLGGLATILYLLVMPMLTMRIFAEDKKSGAYTLLGSAPVSLTDIVLGKYLALLFFAAVLAMLPAWPVLFLKLGANVDFGHLAAIVLGLFLFTAALASAGLFMSTLTKEPVIAAVAGFGLSLLIWLFELFAYGDGALAPIFKYLSLMSHFENLHRGVFNTADVAYYGLFVALFLWLAVQRLDLERN